jgi:hypothetical protein
MTKPHVIFQNYKLHNAGDDCCDPHAFYPRLSFYFSQKACMRGRLHGLIRKV